MIVIDPPFITREVWGKYAAAAKRLLKTGTFLQIFTVLKQQIMCCPPDGSGRVILTTVIENAELLLDLLGASPTVRDTEMAFNTH